MGWTRARRCVFLRRPAERPPARSALPDSTEFDFVQVLDHGPVDRAGLQLVEHLHAAGATGPAPGSGHIATPAAARYGPVGHDRPPQDRVAGLFIVWLRGKGPSPRGGRQSDPAATHDAGRERAKTRTVRSRAAQANCSFCGYEPHGQHGELYDLRKDSAERHSLYEERPDMVKDMKARLKDVKNS
jgi:hypothetical protein